MSFITFEYSVKGVSGYFTGKVIVDYISDDHLGLDLEVKSYLLDGLNRFRSSRKSMPKNQTLKSKDVRIGVIGFSEGGRVPVYSSSAKIEARMFDFYCEEQDGTRIYFINGRKI